MSQTIVFYEIGTVRNTDSATMQKNERGSIDVKCDLINLMVMFNYINSISVSIYITKKLKH